MKITRIRETVPLLKPGVKAMAQRIVAEDIWGGETTSAVVAHFATSTPAEYLQNTTDLMNYNTRSIGTGGAVARGGKLYAPETQGFGVVPDLESLRDPVGEYAL